MVLRIRRRLRQRFAEEEGVIIDALPVALARRWSELSHRRGAA
jgi:hypothetical protein